MRWTCSKRRSDPLTPSPGGRGKERAAGRGRVRAGRSCGAPFLRVTLILPRCRRVHLASPEGEGDLRSTPSRFASRRCWRSGSRGSLRVWMKRVRRGVVVSVVVGVRVAVDLDDQRSAEAQDVGVDTARRAPGGAISGPERPRAAPRSRRRSGSGASRRSCASAVDGAGWLVFVEAHPPSPFRRCAAPSLSQGEGTVRSLSSGEGGARTRSGWEGEGDRRTSLARQTFVIIRRLADLELGRGRSCCRPRRRRPRSPARCTDLERR